MKYQKIQTVFKRDPDNRFKTLLEGEFAEPEFEFLKDDSWVWTEKVDGTCIRVLWNGMEVEFRGKTDKAQPITFLWEKLTEMFPADLMVEVFGGDPEHECGYGCKDGCVMAEHDAWLYGEGYGNRIQKNGENYIPDGVSFILFDVRRYDKQGDYLWLERENVEDIAQKFGIDVVPIIGEGTLAEAIELVREGFPSVAAAKDGFMAEGLVMRPKTELRTRRGQRVITKIKHKDFAG